jgi:3-oxoacyl-(acyl-carrier-protein) synthase
MGRRIAAGLDAGGIGLSDIDLIVSGASGSRAGDRFEGRALEALFGDREMPPVLAPKGVTGEYGGAFLAAAVLASRRLGWGPAAGFARVDRRLGIAPATGTVSIRASGRLRALATSFSAAGHAAWVLMEADASDRRDCHRDPGV